MYIYDWIDEHNVAKETQRHFVAPMNKDNGWKGKIQLTVAFACGSDAVFILCEAVALCNENRGTCF